MKERMDGLHKRDDWPHPAECRLCKTCKHLDDFMVPIPLIHVGARCKHPSAQRSLVTGDALTLCWIARGPGHPCGPSGNYWDPKE